MALALSASSLFMQALSHTHLPTQVHSTHTHTLHTHTHTTHTHYTHSPPLEVVEFWLVQEVVGEREAVVAREGHHCPVPLYELWSSVGTGVQVYGTRTQQWRLHMTCSCSIKVLMKH